MINSNQLFTKKIVALALLTTTSFSHANLSLEAVNHCYETQREGAWKYVEYFFVVQPTNKIQATTKKVASIMLPTAAALFLARHSIYNYVAGSKTIPDVEKAVTPATTHCCGCPVKPEQKPSPSSFLSDGPTIIASGVLYVAGGYAYLNQQESNIKHDALVNFLHNWNFHRAYVPVEFVEAFDELSAYYQASESKTFSNAQVSQIFEIVQHLIEHCFEKRYPRDKKGDDLLSSVKMITEIGKNLSPAK
jgi:hypothetical protein